MPKTYTCLRCDHSWQTRIDHLPVRCPKCQSTRWDKPRNGATGPTVKEELLEACKGAFSFLYALGESCPSEIYPQIKALYAALEAAIARAEKEG